MVSAMTDIVERLRKNVGIELSHEAADEIERLLEINRMLEAAVPTFEEVQRLDEKQAEIERLREQLDIARLALSAPTLGDIPR
jgi:hypothetical protein